MKTLKDYISTDLKSLETSLHEASLLDIEGTLDSGDYEIKSYNKIGKQYEIESYIDRNACITISGDSSKVLNAFSSIKLKNFNKTLYQFDLKSKYGINASSKKIVKDNKIELLHNIILNMDYDWIVNDINPVNYSEKIISSELKKYFSNFIKDGWEKYLVFTKYNYKFGYMLEIHIGIVPNSCILINFKKK